MAEGLRRFLQFGEKNRNILHTKETVKSVAVQISHM